MATFVRYRGGGYGLFLRREATLAQTILRPLRKSRNLMRPRNCNERAPVNSDRDLAVRS